MQKENSANVHTDDSLAVRSPVLVHHTNGTHTTGKPNIT